MLSQHETYHGWFFFAVGKEEPPVIGFMLGQHSVASRLDRFQVDSLANWDFRPGRRTRLRHGRPDAVDSHQ
eukprot:5497135-Lingulodinium_polyedra.AAC.1